MASLQTLDLPILVFWPLQVVDVIERPTSFTHLTVTVADRMSTTTMSHLIN